MSPQQRVEKTATELSFEEGREYAADRLRLLAEFADSLGDQTEEYNFFEWEKILLRLERSVRTAHGPQLSEAQVQYVYDFSQALIHAHPKLEPKLVSFWNFLEDAKTLLGKDVGQPGLHLRKIIRNASPSIRDTNEFYMKVAKDVDEQPVTYLTPAALLLIHVIRTETIEYAITNQLQAIAERFNLNSKYDIPDMCSVDTKIKMNTIWRTDVRAIRDAITHHRFTIEVRKADWKLTIKFTDHGYDFKKEFSMEEFISFIDDHTFLLSIQLNLIMIMEILVILSTHFISRPLVG